MPPSERAVVNPRVQGEATIADRNRAAFQLIDTWLREDTSSRGARHPSSEAEPDSWESLKTELDRDRPSDRKLFR